MTPSAPVFLPTQQAPRGRRALLFPLVARQLPNFAQNGFIFDKFDTNPQPDGWTARYDSVSIELFG